jgi:hypothetical protein
MQIMALYWIKDFKLGNVFDVMLRQMASQIGRPAVADA